MRLFVLSAVVGSGYCTTGSGDGSGEGSGDITCPSGEHVVSTENGDVCFPAGGPGTPCPSECWAFDTVNNACVLPSESDCFTLTCAHDRMSLEFQSRLFNVENQEGSGDEPFGSGDHEPSFANNVWTMDCPLGDCGMTAESVDGDIVFSVQVNSAAEALSLESNLVKIAPSESAITFKCSYAASVDVQTAESFTVKGATATGATTKTGDLGDGFELKLYVDEDQNTEADETNVIIGYPLYGEVSWSVSSVHSLVNFFVDECSLVDEDDKEVKFIRGNCYSSALGAEQLQEDKFVADSSKFKFTAFIIGEDVLQMENAMIKCTTKICLVGPDGEDCTDGINTSDQDCATDDGNGNSLAGYGYVAQSYVSAVTTTIPPPPP